jgi:hypothetical protein
LTDQQEPPYGSDPFDPYADLSDLTGDDSLPALEDPSVPAAVPPRSPLLTGLIVALLLVVVSVSVFQLLREDDSTNGGTAAPIATTTTSTTEPTDTSPGTPTTAPTATTAASPATTVAVSVPGTFEPYTSVGELIPFDDLTMKVDGLGPISFGTPAAEAIGRLIASLDDPDEDTGPVVSTGAYGACENKLERIVRWGPFVAIVVVDEDGTETFGGYRLDFSYGEINHQATDLQTLSGLKAGQSVVALEDIYENFSVTYEVIPDLGTTFQLRSSNSGNLLLWGPVTSDDSNGIVLGIYAPDACGRFQ